MKPVRLNTLVVDTSVFAKRPSPAEVKVFFETKLHLDMTNVKRIQLHNIKNVVYLGMKDLAVAERIAADHHLKHHMMIGGKEIPIPVPVYIESSTTDVRLHDLPEEIDNQTIIDHMTQYGEVISIREELWKNFWPGFSNGVIVCRMRLAQHIPSYVNFPEFEDSISLVSYRGQTRTCSKCARAIHPKQRCSEAAAAEKQNLTPNALTTAMVVAQANNNNNLDRRPAVIAPASNAANEPTIAMAATQTQTNNKQTASTMTSNEQSFPALPNSTPEPESTSSKPANVQKQTNTKPPAAAATPNEKQQNNKTPRIKRQLSEEQQTANKKPSGSNPREERGDLFDTDSTEVHIIVTEMLSQCDLSAMPGTETQKQQCILDSARYFAKRNLGRQKKM